ncbi:unnamed protein product, partial [Citrullus colocynthis]
TIRMAKYLSLMKQAAESMQLARSLISQDDLFSYALAGFDAEYLHIVCDILEEFNNPEGTKNQVNNSAAAFTATPETATN